MRGQVLRRDTVTPTVLDCKPDPIGVSRRPAEGTSVRAMDERRRRAEELLNREVRSLGIRLGVTVDLLLDADVRRALGLDVLCGDGVHRFLPLAASEPGGERYEVSSALLLSSELAFYREHGRALSSLRGRRLPEGVFADLVLGAGWDVVAVAVETEEGVRELPRDTALPLAPDALRPAV